MKKTLYQLNWEILSAADLVGDLPPNMPTPKPLLRKIYSGNGMRLMDSPKPRQWTVTIETKAQADSGEIHTHTLRFQPSEPVYFSSLMDVVKHKWIDDCDNDLADMVAISAHAVARCLI